MTPEKLYDIYRACGEKYWLELSSDEHERWERIAKAVERFVDDECGKSYMDGWTDGQYDE